MGNDTASRPVISMRLDRNILSKVDLMCQEINIERTQGLTNVIRYLIKPENVSVFKVIMKNG